MGKEMKRKEDRKKCWRVKQAKEGKRKLKRRGHIQKLIYGNVIKRKNQREIKRIEKGNLNKKKTKEKKLQRKLENMENKYGK